MSAASGYLHSPLTNRDRVGGGLRRRGPSIGLPEFAQRKIVDTYHRGREAVAHAVAAGVTIAAGTDIITTGAMWGSNGHELALLAECGLSPIEAIRAATATGRSPSDRRRG